MPTYVYACTECGHRFEAVQAFSGASLSECPNCGGRLRKVFNSVGIVFKGSGFYRNDSREKAPAAAGSGSAASDKGGSDKSGSDKGGSDKGGTAKGGSDKGGTGKGGSDKGGATDKAGASKPAQKAAASSSSSGPSSSSSSGSSPGA